MKKLGAQVTIFNVILSFFKRSNCVGYLKVKQIILIARELISPTLPILNCSDNGQKAIDIMDSFRISHLPVVRKGEYLGLISDADIYDKQMEMCEMGNAGVAFIRPSVKEIQHIYEVIQKFIEANVSVLPVLDLTDEFIGAITITDLSKRITELVGTTDPGAVIVLEMNSIDYSLSQIAQIVESNDAKVISLYTQNGENVNQIIVTLKVNITDVSSIIQTFVRFDYAIKAVYMDDSLLKDMYSERYELFMKYLDI